MSSTMSRTDHYDVTAVAVAYTWALDTNEWAALDNVFHPDATADLGGGLPTLVGREAIVARIRQALEPLDDSQHLVGSHEVQVDGDTATHRCYLQAQHVRHAATGSPNYLIAGRYEDELVRTPSGWRITYRRLTVMWSDGNLEVVRH